MAYPSIEYQKVMTEVVYINLPAPSEPKMGMSGMELLHGFLGEFARTTNAEVKAFVNTASAKWNVQFRTPSLR
ncbi:MAG: hypothetical protein JW856_00455 [Dehalococcoidales bacterium]|nr:hypothetical protein [Dehalococcoidales bacterium]